MPIFPQSAKKLSFLHSTRLFVTVITTSCHFSLYRALWVQFTHCYSIYLKPILILSFHLCLGLPSHLFPSGFPTKSLYTNMFSSIRATCPTQPILLDLITRITFDDQYRSRSSSLSSLLSSSVTSSFLDPKNISHPTLEHSQPVFFPKCERPSFAPIYDNIHSFSSLSYERSTASSEASSPHNVIYCFLFCFKVTFFPLSL